MGLLSKPDEVDRGEMGLAGNDQGRGKLLVLLLAEQRRTNELLERLVTVAESGR